MLPPSSVPLTVATLGSAQMPNIKIGRSENETSTRRSDVRELLLAIVK